MAKSLLKITTKSKYKQQQLHADVEPDLDPVLLVPGIAGSILNAVDNKTGDTERVWVRILGADHEFCSKLWSRFDPSTGKTVSLDPDSHIEVPEDRYGLYAIDVLDPDLIIGQEAVYYFHEMIDEMLSWGYEEGKTLFGFGYDFRQSNRLQDTLDLLTTKLQSVYTASGGKKMNLISHSMGGLLVKCFLSLHTDIFEKYVQNWIAIAAPFQGAPGYITSALLNGMSFVDGWEQNFFISKWSMHQLLVECPSVYELMACRDFDWQHIPLLEIWREKYKGDGNSTIMLESYPPEETISILMEALAINKVNYDGVDIAEPFNIDILNWANETQKVMSCAKVPDTVKFYNIYGTSVETPHSVCYGSEDSPVSNLQELPLLEAKYINVNGDGTVPVESAKADGLNAVARVGVPGEHRDILCDRRVYRILRHWLGADQDPLYNPINDYVILPTSFDIERRQDRGSQVTMLKEEWEMVTDEQDEQDSVMKRKSLVGSIAVSHVRQDKSTRDEAFASVLVKAQSEDKKHVGLKAMCVSTNT